MSENKVYSAGTTPLVIMALMAAAGLVAYFLGGRRAEAELERLAVFWPSFHELHEQDRLMLAQAAARCKLVELPMPVTKNQVAQCLMRGVDKANSNALSGMIEHSNRSPKAE